MKNKKGAFLLDEEGTKLILAAICIVGLISFVVYVFINYSQNKDLNTAKASLTHLINDIDSGNTQDAIYNPSGWILASFPEQIGGTYPINQQKYNKIGLKQCSSDNMWAHCLCLCKAGVDFISTDSDTNRQYMTAPDAIISSCNSQAVCMESDFSINYFDESSLNHFEYNGYLINHVPFMLNIYQQNKTITEA